MAANQFVLHCLGDTHARWPPMPESPSSDADCMFKMDELGPELDRIPLDRKNEHIQSAVDHARQLRATRITAAVEGRPDSVLAFQKDNVSVGSGAFDDVVLSSEQAMPSAFSVERCGDSFRVLNQDHQDVWVNGMRLPCGSRVCTSPRAPVVVNGGMRAKFALTLWAFAPREQ
jgi:hypothetical protein